MFEVKLALSNAAASRFGQRRNDRRRRALPRGWEIDGAGATCPIAINTSII